MQAILLRAVRASKAPILYQCVLQNLGQGVPAESIYTNLLQVTRRAITQELFRSYTQVARKSAPAPARPALGRQPPNRLSKPSTLRPSGSAAGSVPGKNNGDGIALELALRELWRDQPRLQQLREKLVREMWPEDADELKQRLADEQPVVRLVAVQVITQRRLPLEKELIELLTDSSVEVREAARQGLVRLSRGCDFGPSSQATAAQRMQAATAWRRWLALQEPLPSPGDADRAVDP